MSKRSNEGIGSNCGIASVVSCSLRHQNIRQGEFSCDDFMDGMIRRYSHRVARCGRSNKGYFESKFLYSILHLWVYRSHTWHSDSCIGRTKVNTERWSQHWCKYETKHF